MYQTRGRLGPKDSELGWAGGSKELAGETGEHEGCQLGSKAGEEAGGHCETGDRDSRGRVKVRPCIQAIGDHPWGKIQPGVPHDCLCRWELPK